MYMYIYIYIYIHTYIYIYTYLGASKGIRNSFFLIGGVFPGVPPGTNTQGTSP